MEKIDELEQRIEQLERELAESETRRQQLLDESEKTLDIAKHAYKVDHYGFIWVYEWQTKEYVKTDMRVMTPEVAERSIKAKHLADKCIEGRHMVDDLIEGRMIQDNTIDGRSIKPDTIGPEKIVDNSIYGDRLENDALVPGKIADDAVRSRNIADSVIKSNHIASKAVTPEKLSDDVEEAIVAPAINVLDLKYKGITDELRQMIETQQESGIALSQHLGFNENIGVSQKAITNAILKIWNKICDMTGEIISEGFTMRVEPTHIITEEDIEVEVFAESQNPLSGFESLQFFANGVLKDVAHNVESYHTVFTINETSVIRCEAVMLGKTYVQEAEVVKQTPFFMGSGMHYEEVITPECEQPLEGTIEGSYDVTVKNTGEHIFILIPKSRTSEFRRADMNGYEIPFTRSTDNNFLILKSINLYNAGVYNIDIDINT